MPCTRIAIACILASSILSPAAGAVPTTCTQQKIDEILTTATPTSSSVLVECNLSLTQQDVVTKKLIFKGAAASGVTLDCHGATLRRAAGMADETRLLITSRQKITGAWEAPENIAIRNCMIEGMVLVRGMALNGEDKNLTESSRKQGHTERVQANAPNGIVFDHDTFIGQGAIPIYFSPGVHDSSILNSTIGGRSNSVAIYFDAESARNTIKGNRIDTDTRSDNELLAGTLNAVRFLGSSIGINTDSLPNPYRELIAIDSSAGNRVLDNRFGNLNHGGIFLYRNCGEGGNIRQQTPHGNEIINNVFYYDEFDGSVPAIWLSSRNGKSSYCDQDKGYPLGSSLSDLDYATGNFVAQNQFYKFEPAKMIRDNAGNNFIEANNLVQIPITRKAGCFYKDGRPSRLILDGAKVRYTSDSDKDSCTLHVLECNDGTIKDSATACTAMR